MGKVNQGAEALEAHYGQWLRAQLGSGRWNEQSLRWKRFRPSRCKNAENPTGILQQCSQYHGLDPPTSNPRDIIDGAKVPFISGKYGIVYYLN
ncbi:CIC11C00000000710 [Sungouiella intermedia]|uniref:CIC11C00000000710 n=1 Tax=Sungouiella intermedia TaxID=45354 RepID=A0A1L0BML6_9ASCO|nr:CIC11C00000000710 [[Candida] intermedia]